MRIRSTGARRRFLARAALGLALFALGVWQVPHRWCGREGTAWYAGDAALQARLARGVERWISEELDRPAFTTGSSLFDGEWLFGTCLMAGLGFGQAAIEHPERREGHAALLRRCVERMQSPGVRAFDREQWGEDPLDSLDGDKGHVAYLGYFNLLLGLQRLVDTGAPSAPLNDQITAALARRIERSPGLLLETYPGEVYPVDNAAAIASIGLHARAAGTGRPDLVARWAERCREAWIDPATGLLFQAMSARSGVASDRPRGSGTGLAAYFLSFVDPALSRELFEAVRRELAGTFLGFGVVREYPRGMSGRGDIDSGPIVMGWGVSATGFALAGSRIHGDRDLFRRIVATVNLFGAPWDGGGRREFVTGGPLGTAMMFALLTAQPCGDAR